MPPTKEKSNNNGLWVHGAQIAFLQKCVQRHLFVTVGFATRLFKSLHIKLQKLANFIYYA